MFKNFPLTFTEEVASFITKEYKQSLNILEYGSGGSTILAALHNKKVITTESSSAWLIELMGTYKERNLPGDIIPVFSDIGETKAWGHPKDDEKWRQWPSYAVRAWHFCEDNNIQPDLVLVDGRFRVACFIASCVNTEKPIRILFDDYIGRDYYHVVEKIKEPTQIINNHLAVFDVEPGMVDSKFLLNHLSFFHNPD